MKIVGQIVSGKVGRILIRQKSGETIELGDLLVAEEEDGFLLLQVFDLSYASQIPENARELLAGINLEGYGTELEFLEPELRNYVIAELKAVAHMRKDKNTGKIDVRIPKRLPTFFNSVRFVETDDLKFLTKPDNPIYLGKVRSGSKELDVDVYLNGLEVFTHHILIPATTGRGKSNLVKVLLWSTVGQDKFGILILDPHDEYYGRHEIGLKDHPEAKDNVLYYSPEPLLGTNSLIVNLKSIRPGNFQGIVEFTDAQWDAIELYYNKFGDGWISEIVKGTEVDSVQPRTMAVLQRKFDNILGVYKDENGNIICRNNVFSKTSGESTVDDIVRALEEGKIVIIDTSRLSDKAELLIGSIIAGKILKKYQWYKSEGVLAEKPVVSIVLEEAPRVIGSEVLAKTGENIYSIIAKEGRKFKVGLIAITQLTSVIPKTILANINTKIILGNELASERRAIIESASQDLSSDDRAIASLDKGEAIVTTNFTKFAVPIKVPLFSDYIKKFQTERQSEKIVFRG